MDYVGEIDEVRISRKSRPFEFAAVKFFGKILIDNDIVDPNAVSIVDVDTVNNNMVVDGGSWASP